MKDEPTVDKLSYTQLLARRDKALKKAAEWQAEANMLQARINGLPAPEIPSGPSEVGLTATTQLDAFKKDSGWQHAFYEAINGGCKSNYDEVGPVGDVEDILASDMGENDGPPWIAIGKMRKGQFFFMEAGCDYTGWDCQASGSLTNYNTISEACSKLALTPQVRERLRDQLHAVEGKRFCGQAVILDW